MATHGPPNPSSALLFLSLLLLVTASPPPRYLPILSRVATYDDIPSSFASVYQTSPICPDTLTFSDPTIDERLVALLPLSSITQDTIPCTGPDPDAPLSLVSEATVEQPGLLTALGLAPFRAALNANPNAQSLITSSNTTSMLVGHHPTDRTCGDSTFPSSTVYFIIRETSPFRISFNRSNSLELVTLPSQLKALLIVAQNSVVCLLVDRASNPGTDATLTTSSPSGGSQTVPLTPFGSSPLPIPSIAASITPVVSPSPVASTGPVTPGSDVGPPVMASPSVAPQGGDGGAGDDEEIMESGDGELSAELSMEPVESVEFMMGSDMGGAEATEEGNGEQGAMGEVVETGDGMDQGGESNEGNQAESEDGDESACFPGEAEVVLENGEVRRMEDLEIGDRVRSEEGGIVSDVILFTHRERKGWYRFVRVQVECGRILEVSRGHYVYVREGGMKMGGELEVGDELVVEGGESGRIVKIGSVVRRGLYNPQTVGGMVMVNGVKVSTYTSAVEPGLAHGALLAPVRFLYTWMGWRGVSFIEWGVGGGAAGLARMMPRGDSWVRV